MGLENNFLPELTPQMPVIWLLFSVITGLLLITGTDFISPQICRRLQMVRWVLIPYLGLILGGLSPQLMGLTYLPWLSAIEQNGILLLAILAVAILVRIFLEVWERRSKAAPPPSQSIYALQVIEQAQQKKSTSIHWSVLFLFFLQNGMIEFHLTFLRGAFGEILQISTTELPQPLYWATGAAALLMLIERWLETTTWTQRAIEIILLISSSLLFIYTVNYWLCALIRWLGWWIMTPPAQYPMGNVTRVRSYSPIP